MADSLGWMAWTFPTAVFFVFIALMLTIMTVWEMISPTTPRRGLLPMNTTRGDRLFIGLLGSAYINLAWLGLTNLNLWWGVALSAVYMVAVGRWG